MNVPTNLKYTASHEWIRREPDGTLTIGITDHAQEALGDLVFIAPEVINADAYGHWLYKLKPANAADVASLLDAAAYIAAVGEE
jgi:glycine cleavage system H protein